MSPITTHVLDTAKGCPAVNIPVILEYLKDGKWNFVAEGATDNDGRIMDWMENHTQTGEYRIIFHTADYHQNKGFFPSVSIHFMLTNSEQHYHVPLLLSPFSYSTYRGS